MATRTLASTSTQRKNQVKEVHSQNTDTLPKIGKLAKTEHKLGTMPTDLAESQVLHFESEKSENETAGSYGQQEPKKNISTCSTTTKNFDEKIFSAKSKLNLGIMPTDLATCQLTQNSSEKSEIKSVVSPGQQELKNDNSTRSTTTEKIGQKNSFGSNLQPVQNEQRTVGKHMEQAENMQITAEVRKRPADSPPPAAVKHQNSSLTPLRTASGEAHQQHQEDNSDTEQLETMSDVEPASSDDEDESEFIDVVYENRKTKRARRKLAANPNTEKVTYQTTGQNHTNMETTYQADQQINMTLFMKADNLNIVAEIQRKPIAFQKCFDSTFGTPADLTLQYRNQCIKIECRTAQQYEDIKTCTHLMDLTVEVTEPRKRTLIQQRSSPAIYRVVIRNVNIEIEERDIVIATGAVNARRITTKPDSLGYRPKTRVVVLTFEEQPPQTVYIGYVKYPTEVYRDKPMRCNKCQLFCHTTGTCRNSATTCSYCGQNHEYTNCPSRSANQPPKCRNCSGQHSAASPECPIYLNVQNALDLRTRAGLTYRQALTSVTQQEQRPIRPSILLNKSQLHPTGTNHAKKTNLEPESQPNEIINQSTHEAMDQVLMHVAPALCNVFISFVNAISQLIATLPKNPQNDVVIEQLQEATRKFTSTPVTFTPPAPYKSLHLHKPHQQIEYADLSTISTSKPHTPEKATSTPNLQSLQEFPELTHGT